MEIPAGYVGRGRVKGSAWQSPEQIKAAKEEKEQADQAKAIPFQEFRSLNGKYTIFQQTPFAETTHKKANAYIELYKGKVEKVVIHFFKQATCNEFCDLVRRQILNGVFKQYELELFLADDEGNFDDKNEPPPSNETLAKIIDIGLDSFYFKITNSWQLSETDKNNLVDKINNHKKSLSEYQGSLPDNEWETDDDSDDGQLMENNNNNKKKKSVADSNNNNNNTNANAQRACCIIL